MEMLVFGMFTSDLRAEVDLHDVAVLQHGVVAHVRGVMCGHIVDRAARGERNAGLIVCVRERGKQTLRRGTSNAQKPMTCPHQP